MNINGVITAAGLSTRMGDFKPLMLLEGKTLIENCIDSMLDAGVTCVTVVLGYRADEIEALLSSRYNDDQLVLAYNTEYASTDMLTSVKIGIRSLPACDAFFLLPGDMPAVSASTFRALQKTWAQTHAKVVFPAMAGKRKHPPLVSYDCIRDILSYEGDNGLRGIWHRFEEQTDLVTVDDDGCRIDADTMEDYERLTEYMKEKNI